MVCGSHAFHDSDYGLRRNNDYCLIKTLCVLVKSIGLNYNSRVYRASDLSFEPSRKRLDLMDFDSDLFP